MEMLTDRLIAASCSYIIRFVSFQATSCAADESFECYFGEK